MKQFNILRATPAGEPWTNQHGAQLQSYFLDLEDHKGQLVMCNRKVDSPAPSGVVWAEVVEGQTKAGKSKWQLTIKPAPDGTQAPYKAAGATPAPQTSPNTVSWGEALIAASNVSKDVDQLFAIANELYVSKPLPATVLAPVPVETPKDVVVDDVPSEIDLDSIPFN